MAAKGPLPVLLLSLSTWMLAETQESSDYDAFIKNQLDFPKTENAYCNKIMKEKEEDLGYALENTFIHASEQDVQAICSVNGWPQTGLLRSLYPFLRTHCVATSEEGNEFSGTLEYSIILVWCENGLPTYFHGRPLD